MISASHFLQVLAGGGGGGGESRKVYICDSRYMLDENRHVFGTFIVEDGVILGWTQG